MIPVLSLTVLIGLSYQCHRARQAARRWQQEAHATRLALDAVERRQAQREALALALLADSQLELGALHYYDAGEWER